MNKTLKRKMKGLLAFAMSMAIMATSVFFGDTAVFAADGFQVTSVTFHHDADGSQYTTVTYTDSQKRDIDDVIVLSENPTVSGNTSPFFINGKKYGTYSYNTTDPTVYHVWNGNTCTIKKFPLVQGYAKPIPGEKVLVGVMKGGTPEEFSNLVEVTVPEKGKEVTVNVDGSTSTPEEKKEDPKTETPTGNDQKTETTTTTEPTKISDQKPGEEIKVSDKDTKAKKAGTFSVSKDGKSATFTEVNKSATKIEVPATVTNEAGEEIPVTAIDPKAFEGSKATSIDTSKVQTTGLTADQFKGASKVTVIKINGKKLKAGKINKNFLRKLKKLKKVKVVCSKKQFKKIQKALEKAAKKTKRKGGTKVIRVSK